MHFSSLAAAVRLGFIVQLTTSMETLHWKCIVAKKYPNRTAAARLEKRINGNAPLSCSKDLALGELNQKHLLMVIGIDEIYE